MTLQTLTYATEGRIARIILVSTAVAFLSFSGAVGLLT